MQARGTQGRRPGDAERDTDPTRRGHGAQAPRTEPRSQSHTGSTGIRDRRARGTHVCRTHVCSLCLSPCLPGRSTWRGKPAPPEETRPYRDIYVTRGHAPGSLGWGGHTAQGWGRGEADRCGRGVALLGVPEAGRGESPPSGAGQGSDVAAEFPFIKKGGPREWHRAQRHGPGPGAGIGAPRPPPGTGESGAGSHTPGSSPAPAGKGPGV